MQVLGCVQRVAARFAAKSLYLEDTGEYIVVSGPYDLMQQVYPKLKSRGFWYDSSVRAWGIEKAKMTPAKMKNLHALLEPYLPKGDALSEETPPPPPPPKKILIQVPYEYRHIPRQAGGVWDSWSKSWEFSNASVAEKVVQKVEEARLEKPVSPVPLTKRDPNAVVFTETGRSKRDIKHPLNSSFRDPKSGKILTVVKVDSYYVSEDGLSFGLPDDAGWVHTIHAVVEGGEGAVQEVERDEKARMSKSQALHLEQDLIKRVVVPSNYHKAPHPQRVVGEILLRRNRRNVLYGGGTWWVVQPGKAIWYIRNNGADGDDWSANNVQTNGAGAMGYHVPYTKEMDETLHQLDESLGEH